MNFDEAVEEVMRFEGGYINDPQDPGGETKFGISKASYPELEIKALTIEDAKTIYRRDFWDKAQIDALPTSIRLLVFDACVNQGLPTAVMLLQRILMVPRDGIMGPKTLTPAMMANPRKLVTLYAEARLVHYRSRHNYRRYAASWLSRLLDCTIACLKSLGA